MEDNNEKKENPSKLMKNIKAICITFFSIGILVCIIALVGGYSLAMVSQRASMVVLVLGLGALIGTRTGSTTSRKYLMARTLTVRPGHEWLQEEYKLRENSLNYFALYVSVGFLMLFSCFILDYFQI